MTELLLPGNPYATDNDVPIVLAAPFATMALAYEQRTSSLVAYLAIAESRGARDRATNELDLAIRERLGLAKTKEPSDV